MADERTPDIVEQARQHVQSFEAIGGTVAYPWSVRLARYVVLQHEELERLRASHTLREDVIEECAKIVDERARAYTRSTPPAGAMYSAASAIRALKSPDTSVEPSGRKIG